MTEDLHLALIYGSNREGRFCDVVAGWAATQCLINRWLPEKEPGKICPPFAFPVGDGRCE